MKSTKDILLGIVIGAFLVFLMGATLTYHTNESEYHDDDCTDYWGTGNDVSYTWDNTNSEIDWNVTAGSINITLTAQSDDMAGLYVNCTVPTGQQSWGGVYGDMTIAGTTDGVCAAVSGMVWPGASSAPTSIICGGKFGVSETSADLSGATVVGLYVETTLATGGSDPAAHYMMRFNTSQGAETPSHWFQAANQEAVAFTSSAATAGSKVGGIKCAIVGIGDCYIWLYDDYK